MYSPFYSPFLSPIEYIFGIWKHYIIKLWNQKNETKLKTIIQAFHLISQNQIQNFQKECFEYMLKV